jgi:CRISPR-associated protein Cas1
MKRIIDVSGYGCKLKLDCGRLALERKDGSLVTIPVSDVAVVVLSDAAVSVSGAVLAELALEGVTVVVSDRAHLPVGLFQPIAANSRQTAVLLGQIQAKPSIKARLWRKIIEAKVKSQINVLRENNRKWKDIAAIKVERGDVSNVEGAVARSYWQRLGLFPVRNRFAKDANCFLNYGYAVLYATTARALCASGLNTSLGLKHCGPTNVHCLASDVMEPFRAVVDRAVINWVKAFPGGATEISRECRQSILGTILGSRWRTSIGNVSVFDALSRTAVSLRESLLNDSVELELPEYCGREIA